jgi:ABC-type nitrate/sulfonate/bicarbonate transport system substrate-binding protein
MVAMQPWVEQHPEAVKAFRQAIIKTAKFANIHDREARNILGRYVSLEPKILNTVVLPRFIDGSLNEVLLDETILRMRQAGWLKSQFSASDLIKV